MGKQKHQEQRQQQQQQLHMHCMAAHKFRQYWRWLWRRHTGTFLWLLCIHIGIAIIVLIIVNITLYVKWSGVKCGTATQPIYLYIYSTFKCIQNSKYSHSNAISAHIRYQIHTSMSVPLFYIIMIIIILFCFICISLAHFTSLTPVPRVQYFDRLIVDRNFGYQCLFLTTYYILFIYMV